MSLFAKLIKSIRNVTGLAKDSHGPVKIEDINIKDIARTLLDNGSFYCKNWGEQYLLSTFLVLHKVGFQVSNFGDMGSCTITIDKEEGESFRGHLQENSTNSNNLIKSAKEVTYELISPLRGEVRGITGDYDEDEIIGIGLNEFAEEIEKAIVDVDLAGYISGSYDEIKDTVKSIKVGVDIIDGELKAVTKVKCSEELTEEGKEQLKDYILGQYADGFGESFEQHPVTEWKEQVEYQYEEEDEDGNIEWATEYEDVKVGLYVSFWNSKSFDIELTLEGLSG